MCGIDFDLVTIFLGSHFGCRPFESIDPESANASVMGGEGFVYDKFGIVVGLLCSGLFVLELKILLSVKPSVDCSAFREVRGGSDDGAEGFAMCKTVANFVC